MEQEKRKPLKKRIVPYYGSEVDFYNLIMFHTIPENYDVRNISYYIENMLNNLKLK